MKYYNFLFLMIITSCFPIITVQAQTTAHHLSATQKEQHDKFNDEIKRLQERKHRLEQQQRTIDKIISLKQSQLKQLEQKLSIKKVA